MKINNIKSLGAFSSSNSGGGGGGGTTNYNDLSNKPAIDGTTLTSNSTAAALGLATATDLDGKQNSLTTGDGINITNDVVSNPYIFVTNTTENVTIPNGSVMIPGGLEDIKNPGIYTIKLDLSSEMPGFTMSFPLEVSGDGATVCTQILKYINGSFSGSSSNYIFTRMYVNSSWSAWEYCVLQENTQQVNDITSTSVTIPNLTKNTVYNYGTLTDLTITSFGNSLDFVSQFNFSSGNPPTVFTPPNVNGGIYFTGDACENGTFTPAANHRYMVLVTTNGFNVMGFVIEK